METIKFKLKQCNTYANGIDRLHVECTYALLVTVHIDFDSKLPNEKHFQESSRCCILWSTNP